MDYIISHNNSLTQKHVLQKSLKGVCYSDCLPNMYLNETELCGGSCCALWSRFDGLLEKQKSKVNITIWKYYTRNVHLSLHSKPELRIHSVRIFYLPNLLWLKEKCSSSVITCSCNVTRTSLYDFINAMTKLCTTYNLFADAESQKNYLYETEKHALPAFFL